MLRSDVADFVQRLASGEADTPENMAPADARLLYREMCRVNEPPVGELKQVRDLSIAGRDGHSIGARLFVPMGVEEGPSPVLMFMHGGGWVIGDLDTHASLCAELARLTDFRVLAIDYRLAPEAGYPAAWHDCLDAMDWLVGSPADLGVPVAGIVLVGDSAGGALAAACAQRAVADGVADILAIATFYAPFDMKAAGGSLQEYGSGYLLTAEMMTGFRRAYFGVGDAAEEAEAQPAASPLRGEGFSAHPPALIFACEFDPLRDQSRDYAVKLAAHGVSVRYREAKGHIHGCVTLRAAIPSGQADLEGCVFDLLSLLHEARVRRQGG